MTIIESQSKAKPLPSQEILVALLGYDPDSGRLWWKPRARALFRNDAAAAMFATRYEGKEALSGIHITGYKCGRLMHRQYLAHRIIWRLVTGDEPPFIDHINGDRSDNRFANLRSVARIENNQNSAMPSHNKSGVVGVHWVEREQRWQARIIVNNRTIWLGRHKTLEAARSARLAAERKYGFHPNHGRAKKAA